MEKKADYQISSSVNEEIIEIMITGEVTTGTVENLRDEIITIIKANAGENVLMDVRSLKGSLGFGDAYFRVRKYPREFGKIKVAFVEFPNKMGFQSFYEITAHNAGLRFKWFTDIDAAKD